MKKLQLWLVAAAMTVLLIVVALLIVYAAFLSPVAPLVALFIGITLIARYTLAEDVLQFIKWKWL